MAYMMVPVPMIPVPMTPYGPMRPTMFMGTPPPPYCLLHPIPPPRYRLNNVYCVPFYEDNIKVIVAQKTYQVEHWISHVTRLYGPHKVVGLDTEWRPNLKPEDDNPVAIIQLCIGRHCLIFQLLHADMIPRALRKFLGDPNYTFCGVGVEDDVKKLFEHHSLKVESTMNLNEIAAAKRGDLYRYMGLKRMALAVLGKEMVKPKEITLSDWDAAELNTRQVAYAAIDAFVSWQLGSTLLS